MVEPCITQNLKEKIRPQNNDKHDPYGNEQDEGMDNYMELMCKTGGMQKCIRIIYNALNALMRSG